MTQVRCTRKTISRTSVSHRVLEQSKQRLLCLGLVFCLCFGSIAFRVGELMISTRGNAPMELLVSAMEGEELTSEIIAQHKPVHRKDIVDRKGEVIATNIVVPSIFANPQEVNNAERAAKQLSRVLGMDAATLTEKLSDSRKFTWIKRHVTPADQHLINEMGIPGVYFINEEKRIYPQGELFSHALGYVNIDNQGISGIEKQFDNMLNNEGDMEESLQLSLDVRLQHIVRSELKESMEQFNAIGAAGVIMDIQSGEILSMVSLPDFDPNSPDVENANAMFNRASLGTYEMGSTFKTFTTALALESGVTNVHKGYDATHPLKFARHTIRDSHPKSRWLSVPEVYVYSSNIGTAKMALDVGTEKQQAFLSLLGLTKPIDIQLPEKASPLVPATWRDINTITISYGHGISVSPLHTARAIASMVNGGKLLPLTLLKHTSQKAIEGTQVISRDTSDKIRALMRLVVKEGTGGKADVEGYRVGGKTGTAEKISAAGRYQDDKKLTSFVSVFPMDDPRYLVFAMVDEPKGNKSTYGYATGGWIAAPVAGNIIARAAPLLAVKPAYFIEEEADKYWPERDAPAMQTVSTHYRDYRYLHAASY